MADKKMKGKLIDYCDEDSQTSASSEKYSQEILERARMASCKPAATPVDTKSKLSADAGPPFRDPTLYRSLAVESSSTEEGLEKEASEIDPQSLRNRRFISPTSEEVEPEGKRPRYGSSSPNSTLSDQDFPVYQENSPEISTSSAFHEIPPADALTDLICHKVIPVIESWLRTHIRTFAPMPPRNTLSIPGVGNVSRAPRPPRPPGSMPSLELGQQRPQTSAAGSGSQSPPNVGSQQGVEDPSSAQKQRMHQAGGVLHPYYAIVSRITKLEAELNHLKGNINDVRSILEDVTDGVLLEVEHCQSRVSSLENVVKNLRGSSSGLQAELGKSSEGQVTTDHKRCNSSIKIRSSPAADAEAPSGMRARSGPGSISGKDDDESEGPVTIAAGDGLTAANTDINKAPTEPDESQDAKAKNASTSQDDISCSSGGQIRPIPSVDAEMPSDMRARSGPGSTSGNDDESEGPVTVAAGDGLSAANTDGNKATAESDGSQDEKKNADTSQDGTTQ